MSFFAPAPELTREKVLKWLGRVEYAEFQRLLGILIEEQFDLAGRGELKDPIGFLSKCQLTSAASLHVIQAMRFQICSQVLQEILTKKTILKTNNHGQTDQGDRTKGGADQSE